MSESRSICSCNLHVVRVHFHRLTLTALVVCCLLVLNSSPAISAYPYASNPKDVESIKTKISESLVLVKYGANPQIAFSASYDITQSLKDQGTYSILVTPEAPITNCFRTPYDLRRLGLNLEYKGINYKGTCYGWGIDYVDMASIHTTVSIPQLSLWDNYWPQIGGWLIAVYYIPNYGITFRETRVGIVDKSKYILGIEKFSTPPADGLALIFNQDASFVGVMTNKSYGSVPAQFFKVHGAPLQCDLQGNDGNSLTRCNGTRKSTNESAQAGVWTIDDVSAPNPTSTPKPTPSTTNQDLSREATEAFNLALATYSRYKSAIQGCLSTTNGKSISERAISSLIDSNRLCYSENNSVESSYRTLADLRSNALSSSASQSTINRISEINSQFSAAQRNLNLAETMMRELLAVSDSYLAITEQIDNFSKEEAKLNEITNRLPSKVKTLLTKSDAFRDVEDYKIKFEDFKNQLESIRYRIKSISIGTFDYSKISDNILQIERALPSRGITDRALTRARESIPTFYCQNGATFTLSKTKSCPKNYRKISINKSTN